MLLMMVTLSFDGGSETTCEGAPESTCEGAPENGSDLVDTGGAGGAGLLARGLGLVVEFGTTWGLAGTVGSAEGSMASPCLAVTLGLTATFGLAAKTLGLAVTFGLGVTAVTLG